MRDAPAQRRTSAVALDGSNAARRDSAGAVLREPPLHIVVTVNAAWNIWNFRRPLITALLADGHEVTVLAPEDGPRDYSIVKKARLR